MTEARHSMLPDGLGVVARLAAGRAGEAQFLEPHHVEAAARLSRLFVRARLAQRVTMSYDPARVGTRNTGRAAQPDLADSAAGARQRLSALARQIPTDCWGVLIDVCGFEKGLQQIETERGWPRRSAKLVLRIGLDHLALAFGLDDQAKGNERAGLRQWLPERPAMFADSQAEEAAGR